MFNKIISALLLLSFSSAAFSVSAFTVTPFTSSATVRSTGQTSVRYTVTNQATSNIPQLSVTPGWLSSGSHLSLSHDGCSGQTLARGASCTFDIDILGSYQSGSFTLQPKVCGFNGLLCSQAANTFSVNFIQNSLPQRIYETIFPSDVSSEALIGININNTHDIIRAEISGPQRDGRLVISPDGSKVYVVHNDGDDSYSLLVFSVSANSLTQTSTSYNLTYGGYELGNPGQLALTSNGNALYIANNSYSGSGYPVYKIDLTNPNHAAAVTGIADATEGGLVNAPKGLVVSPDGKTVYLANSTEGFNHIFSFSTTVASPSITTVARETNLSSIVSLMLSSDGSTLYSAGQLGEGDLPAVIQQYNIADNFSLTNTTSPTSETSGNILTAALSPDNSTIYSVLNNGDSFPLYSINTSNMLASSPTTFPYHLALFMYNFNYLAYSPDGSVVSILNYGEAGNLTAFFNPSTPSSVTTVNPASGGGTVYTNTNGSFIG